MPLRVRVRIDGLREVIAAFDALPPDAQAIARERSNDLADELTGAIKRDAAVSGGRQGALAARSVRTAKGKDMPTIEAGRSGGRKARGVLFGQVFGAKRHFGWYDNPSKYYDSEGTQFPPHRGADSYWFFSTVDREGGRIGRAYSDMLAELCDRWGR